MDILLKNSILICKIKMNLTAANVSELLEDVKVKIENYKEYERIEIDLKEVNSIDSMGITFLIGVYKMANKKNKKFKLSGVSAIMLSLFKTIKLDELFEIEN